MTLEQTQATVRRDLIQNAREVGVVTVKDGVNFGTDTALALLPCQIVVTALSVCCVGQSECSAQQVGVTWMLEVDSVADSSLRSAVTGVDTKCCHPLTAVNEENQEVATQLMIVKAERRLQASYRTHRCSLQTDQQLVVFAWTEQ